MSLLDWEIEYTGSKTTIRELFKDTLREALVNDPPKRLLGDSDWLHQMAKSLVVGGVLKGSQSKDEDGCIDVDFEWSNFDSLIKSLIEQL